MIIIEVLTKLLLVHLFIIPLVSSSNGDRSIQYQKCLNACKISNCTTDLDHNSTLVFKEESKKNQQLGAWLLRWSCTDECKYLCMWTTVTWFQKHQVTPKFHGKWPFYRLFGIQEPASALFSLLNLVAHYRMFKKMSNRLRNYDTPFKTTWKLFAVICIHAWSWSTIFHTRDTPFTEFMDYTCALSMVLAFFAVAVVRSLFPLWHPYSALLVLCPALLYYVDHMRYLWTGAVDYDFNMILNIGLGVVAGSIWLVFAIWQYFRHRQDGAYVWRIAAFTLLSAACLVLEVFDFPPILGAFDAHALWHLSTAPLPYLFYEFVIDDINFIMATKSKYKEI